MMKTTLNQRHNPYHSFGNNFIQFMIIALLFSIILTTIITILILGTNFDEVNKSSLFNHSQSKIIIGICVSQFIAFGIFLLLGRNILVKPYHKLTSSQEDLNHAKQEFEKIAQIPLNNPNPLLQISANGKLLFANPAARNQYPDIEENFSTNPLMKGINQDILYLILENEELHNSELHIGNTYYQRTIAPNYSRFQKSLTVYFSNISAIKKAQEKARLMEAAIVNANDGVVISSSNLDEPGPEIIYVNDAFSHISGYTKEDIIGKNPRILQGEQTDRSQLDQLRRSLENGEPFKGELKNYHKNGDEYWLDISIVPVTNDNGQITHYAAIERDITERKQFEKDLIQAKNDAEQANISKSEFLANMSHELRTPMNGILGMAELLMDTITSPEEHEMLQTIRNSGNNLLSLLNDILDISKVEAGDLTIENVPFDLDIAVRELFQLYQPLASDKNIELILNKNENLPTCIMGDLGRFQQILRNLISNAIKFTEQGSVTLSLYNETDEEDEWELYFSVRDTGIGIPDNKLGTIFDKFSQADNSTSRRFGGTGLGLAISKQLVELMGGRIGVESVENEGTIFYCAFPIVHPEEGSKPVNIMLESPTEASQHGFSTNARILAVDDHPVNIKFIHKLLSKMGFIHIDTVDCAVDALELLKHNHYDIVFMDCQMPELDGYKATQMIREQEANTDEHQVIIAMTANAMLGDKEKCLKAGMDDYISKPVKAEQLTKILSKWLPKEDDSMNEPNQETSSLIKQNEDDSLSHRRENSEIIDMSHFLIMFDNIESEEANEMLEIFSEQGFSSLNILKQSCESHQQIEWRKEAHKLKGSAATLGAVWLADACFKAEQLQNASENEKLFLLETINKEFFLVRTFITDYLNRTPDTEFLHSNNAANI